ncbi:hypothetical protein SCATT_22900 [Streptantibioticus cattleyicolor NRRL 8057 = DSM 46488]|uniref:Uncharacterized protein n=1 Tax=Streptantibioticus cattleyicolor (strain ATCC 35852 / DSM 46488 / JCM 4925 / NBRC 14057 / NRRL 8057) TaxID=1003195 RepID=F8K0P2_STREN|nr:hypothetical protein SCATT_22900 [Streptantibioticus cattleyicolor NRRL 8057 = DSM 46488]CCB75019.1 protein of unknown function [Streptantibioticus cattleyicolor NRRL 8057 = DSM 46488]
MVRLTSIADINDRRQRRIQAYGGNPPPVGEPLGPGNFPVMERS